VFASLGCVALGVGRRFLAATPEIVEPAHANPSL
jgi:hypothetical protein